MQALSLQRQIVKLAEKWKVDGSKISCYRLDIKDEKFSAQEWASIKAKSRYIVKECFIPDEGILEVAFWF